MKGVKTILCILFFCVFCFSFVASEEYISPVDAYAEDVYSRNNNYLASETYDGDIDRYSSWFTNQGPTFPVDLDLDFGKMVSLGAVEIYAHYYYTPMTFDIFVSDDGSSWELVVENEALPTMTTSNNKYHRFEFNITEKLRHLRIRQLTNSRMNYGGGITEVRGVLVDGGGNESTVVNESLICSDSDGGKVTNVFGEVTYPNGVRPDDCLICDPSDCSYGGTPGNCGAEDIGCAVREGYCDDNLGQYFERILCPNGCEDGVCLNESTGSDYIIEEDFGLIKFVQKGDITDFDDFFSGLSLEGGQQARYKFELERVNYIDSTAIIARYSDDISFSKFNDFVISEFGSDDYRIDYENLGQISENVTLVDGAQILTVSALSDDTFNLIWTSNEYLVVFSYEVNEKALNEENFEGLEEDFSNFLLAHLSKYKSSLVVDTNIFQCASDYDCPVEKTSFCEGDSACSSAAYFNCMDYKCVSVGGGGGCGRCNNGCEDGECQEKKYPKRDFNACSDFTNFIKDPYSFEDKNGKGWTLRRNRSEMNDYVYIDGERYPVNNYNVYFRYENEYGSEADYELGAKIEYELFDFIGNVSNDDLEDILYEYIEGDICSIVEEEDESIYYLCDSSIKYDLKSVEDYASFNDDFEGVIVWIKDNYLLIQEIQYWEQGNYYESYFDDDLERMIDQVSRELDQTQERQKSILGFLSELEDNEAEYVNPGRFYWNMPWIIEEVVKGDHKVCMSDIKEGEDACYPSWRCVDEPAICPAHGTQTRRCIDTEGCFESTERSTKCNPGICSGCMMPRWIGRGWNELQTKCMPYGARFEYSALMGGYDEIPGGVFEDKYALVDVKILNDNKAKYTVTLKKYNETRTYYLYERNTVKIDIFENLGEKAPELYIDKIIYDTSMEGDGEIRFTLVDESNAYCDYDGQIREQKVKGYSGEWAKCQNNFECDSNLCSSGECVEVQDMLAEVSGMREIGVRVLCSLADLFLVQEYESCIFENLGEGVSSSSSGSSGGGSGGGSNSPPSMPN
jgi:hypothetical protein